MRRVRLVLAVAAVLVAMLATVPGPAIAADFERCRDLRGDFVRCDGDLYVAYDPFDYYDFYDPFYFYNPFFYPGFYDFDDNPCIGPDGPEPYFC